MLWKNFTKDEFACRCGCGSNQIRDEIIALVVSSGFRCSEHPVEKNKTKPGTGTHCRGIAADLAVSHRQAKEVLAVALALDLGGVGVHQKGDGRFIHIDVDPERQSLLWTY